MLAVLAMRAKKQGAVDEWSRRAGAARSVSVRLIGVGGIAARVGPLRLMTSLSRRAAELITSLLFAVVAA